MKSRAWTLAAIAGSLFITTAWAQDAPPRRKAGLWEIVTEVPGGRPGMSMQYQQCLGSDPDSQSLQKALTESPDSKCTMRNTRATPGSYETDYSCSDAQGRTEGRFKLSGDFERGYTMDNQMRFDPPRRGRTEAAMKMQARWMGDCPADMRPGETRMTGMPMPAGRPERGASAPRSMTPEQQRKLMEIMRLQKPPGG